MCEEWAAVTWHGSASAKRTASTLQQGWGRRTLTRRKTQSVMGMTCSPSLRVLLLEACGGEAGSDRCGSASCSALPVGGRRRHQCHSSQVYMIPLPISIETLSATCQSVTCHHACARGRFGCPQTQPHCHDIPHILQACTSDTLLQTETRCMNREEKAFSLYVD